MAHPDPHLRLALLFATCSWWVGCGPSEPGPNDLVEQLRECPAGDHAWRPLLDHADVESDGEGLRESLTKLQHACEGRWEPVWAIAESLMREDRTADAAQHLAHAVELARAAADPAGVALGANGLGWVAYTAGEYDESETLYREALQAAGEAKRVDLASYVHNNLAGLLKDLGRFAQARESLEAAEQGLTELGRDDVALSLAHNRAVILLELGNAAAAAELLERNHERASTVGDAWLRDAAAVVLGQLHLAREEPELARPWFERVAAESPRLRLRADLGIGMTAWMAGEPDEAIERLDGLLATLAESDEPDRHLVATIEIFLARALIAGGQLDRAGRILERLRDEGEEIGAEDAGWASRWLLAKLRSGEGGKDEAIALLRDAVALLDAQSAQLDPLGHGLYFLRGRSDPYVDLAATLVRSVGSAASDDVWDLSARSRARALRTLLGNERPGSAITLDALRGGLRPGDVVLSYLIGDDVGVVVAVTRSEVRMHTLRGRVSFRDALAGYVAHLDPSRSDDSVGDAAEHGRLLRAELLGPVEDLVAGASTLYVIPDRELALLPFAALPAKNGGSSYLGQRIDVAVLPLAGLPPAWSAADSGVLLAGRPTFDGGGAFHELPWAAFELSGLQRIWSERDVRLVDGDAFTRSGLQALTSERFGIVHLATHAVASTLDPRECGVVLSNGDRLGIDDIVAMDLAESLVVLSACRTGEGELVPGEGVVGLGWAFLRAGARGIVVSRWAVDDVSAAKLMVEFHRHLRAGKNPAHALGLARRARAKENPDPATWAQFDIILRP